MHILFAQNNLLFFCLQIYYITTQIPLACTCGRVLVLPGYQSESLERGFLQGTSLAF